MSEMLSVDHYRELILSSVKPLPARRTSLQEAFGLVPAWDIRSEIDIPPFPSSAMDGFAVQGPDLAQASAASPVKLRRAGSVSMGSGGPSVGVGETVAVPTGGMVPDGADAVVPIELCTEAAHYVLFESSVARGKNVRPTGEDVQQGAVIVAAGCRLGPAEIGVLAAAGVQAIDARPAPRVGILSTGDELVRPGASLTAGQIYDSNSSMLHALVRSVGGLPVDLGHVPDDPDQLLERLRRAGDEVDAVVCSGGVSAGANDPVKRAFSQGQEICCVNVAMQPGRPQAFGIWHGRPFFGLPGNPGAAFVSFYVFVLPALARMGGAEGGSSITAILGAEVVPAGNRCRFVPALLSHSEGNLVAMPLPPGGSNLLTPIAAADALLEVPPGAPSDVGNRCRVILLRPHTG